MLNRVLGFSPPQVTGAIDAGTRDSSSSNSGYFVSPAKSGKNPTEEAKIFSEEEFIRAKKELLEREKEVPGKIVPTFWSFRSRNQDQALHHLHRRTASLLKVKE